MKGRGERGTLEAIKLGRKSIPFRIKGIDSDNDSAFINHHLERNCSRESITFTRCRPYKKDDRCHVEQKNWSIEREFIGYRGYETEEELRILQEVNPLISRYHNFFWPMKRLVEEEREGSKVRKR